MNKTLLQIVSWIGVVMGTLAVLGSISPFDPYALFGGVLFFTQGLLALMYINEKE